MKRAKIKTEPPVQLLRTDAAAVGAPVWRRRGRVESGVVVAVRDPGFPAHVQVRVCWRQGGRFFVPFWGPAREWYLDEREPLGRMLAEACRRGEGAGPPRPTRSVRPPDSREAREARAQRLGLGSFEAFCGKVGSADESSPTSYEFDHAPDETIASVVAWLADRSLPRPDVLDVWAIPF